MAEQKAVDIDKIILQSKDMIEGGIGQLRQLIGILYTKVQEQAKKIETLESAKVEPKKAAKK